MAAGPGVSAGTVARPVKGKMASVCSAKDLQKVTNDFGRWICRVKKRARLRLGGVLLLGY